MGLFMYGQRCSKTLEADWDFYWFILVWCVIYVETENSQSFQMLHGHKAFFFQKNQEN